MRQEAQALIGELDFSSFRASSCQSSTAMRRVDFVEVFRTRDLIVVDIQANAFLHHMVRNIVGTLLAVGRGQLQVGSVQALLDLRDRTRVPETAPANGLYLVNVAYPQHFAICQYPMGPLLLPVETD